MTFIITCFPQQVSLFMIRVECFGKGVWCHEAVKECEQLFGSEVPVHPLVLTLLPCHHLHSIPSLCKKHMKSCCKMHIRPCSWLFTVRWKMENIGKWKKKLCTKIHTSLTWARARFSWSSFLLVAGKKTMLSMHWMSSSCTTHRISRPEKAPPFTWIKKLGGYGSDIQYNSAFLHSTHQITKPYSEGPERSDPHVLTTNSKSIKIHIYQADSSNHINSCPQGVERSNYHSLHLHHILSLTVWTEADSEGRQVSRAWGNVQLKISKRHWHVLSQVWASSLGPLLITRFSRQFVPERANCSLSVTSSRALLYLLQTELTCLLNLGVLFVQCAIQYYVILIHFLAIWTKGLQATVKPPTLLHTPVELSVQVLQEYGTQHIKILSEYIHDGIQGMVTGCCHPLILLQWL